MSAKFIVCASASSSASAARCRRTSASPCQTFLTISVTEFKPFLKGHAFRRRIHLRAGGHAIGSGRLFIGPQATLFDDSEQIVTHVSAATRPGQRHPGHVAAPRDSSAVWATRAMVHWTPVRRARDRVAGARRPGTQPGPTTAIAAHRGHPAHQHQRVKPPSTEARRQR
jgi:hypothetical protein